MEAHSLEAHMSWTGTRARQPVENPLATFTIFYGKSRTGNQHSTGLRLALEFTGTWVYNLDMILSGSMTLGKLFDLSMLQFPKFSFLICRKVMIIVPVQ